MKQNYEELAKNVKDYGTVSILMKDLRDLENAGKLGRNVTARITHALRERGIQHFPETLPFSQDDRVRLYSPQCKLGRVIWLLINPSEATDLELYEFLMQGLLEVPCLSVAPGT